MASRLPARRPLRAIDEKAHYTALTRVAAQQRRSTDVLAHPDLRPDDSVQTFARDDDHSFGILSSTIHRIWFDARCSRLETRPRYPPTTVFDSFPWPTTPSSDHVDSVAKASAAIQEARARYLDQAVLAAYGFSAHHDTLAQLQALNLAAASDPAVATAPAAKDVPRPTGPPTGFKPAEAIHATEAEHEHRQAALHPHETGPDGDRR